MTETSTHRYGGMAQFFHWLIALLIFIMFGLGWYMADLELTDPDKFRLYQIHKSLGITILGLAVLRLLWRLTHPAPPLPDTMAGWEKLAAAGAHWALYGLIFLQPVLGVLQSNAANFPIVFFGDIELPALIGMDKALGETLAGLHHLVAKLLAVVILLHVAAALRHHFMLGDDILRRMLPGAGLGALVVLLALGGLAPAFVFSDATVPKPTTTLVENVTADVPKVETVTAEEPKPEAAAASPASEAASADPDAWTIEGTSSILGFIAQQQGSPVAGSFDAFEAEIVFDKDDLENSRIHVGIDATSITTGHSDRDQTLNSPSFFDTKQWPDAAFESDDITAADEEQYEAAGTLTIRDITKDVVLTFTLDITDDPDDPTRMLAHAKGELPIMRLDYGVGQGDWTSTVTVADEVIITIDIQASRPK